jgi:hypothetical protein
MASRWMPARRQARGRPRRCRAGFALGHGTRLGLHVGFLAKAPPVALCVSISKIQIPGGAAVRDHAHGRSYALQDFALGVLLRIVRHCRGSFPGPGAVALGEYAATEEPRRQGLSGRLTTCPRGAEPHSPQAPDFPSGEAVDARLDAPVGHLARVSLQQPAEVDFGHSKVARGVGNREPTRAGIGSLR